MKHLFTLLCLLFFTSSFVHAQQRNCSAMDYLEIQLQQNPKMLEKMNQIEKNTERFINNPTSQERGTVYTIPVVVHVVYNNTTENISTAQVMSQLQVLNDDFRRLNSDANGTWSQAADSEIEFCLATVDPSGNPTTGITRTSTNVTSFGLNDEMKFDAQGGKDAWPAADYMNLWVGDISSGYLGYAQFPGGDPATDGVVIDYAYFGTTGTATSPFDLGRTATHEVGHWLNLRHIWGDGACGVDDFVSDTPTSDAANYGCATGHSSCGTTDMVENYMDYSDDACMNLFTSGQNTRMRALFASGGAKASLLNSGACGTPVTPTCSDGIQNGNETGIDCGGDCSPCSSTCSDNDVNISITFDNYPEETSWQILNSSGSVVESGGTYGSEADGSTLSIDVCLTDGCYDFVINDTYGDGICCSYGNGSYSVTSGGSTLASGGSFGSSESTNFCFGGTAPTCSDGIQNGDETGVDCGGSSCAPCYTCNDGVQNGSETGVDCGGNDCAACPTCNDGIQNGNETGIDCGGDCNPCGGTGGSTELFAHYFESGWDGWIDGGGDCYRYNGSRSPEGNRSIRLRDNSSTASSMTLENVDLTPYSSLDIAFSFYAYSMENNENFFVKYHDGVSWKTVADFVRGTDFNNNTFYTATVTMTTSNFNFISNGKLRFQCDASSNADHIYIDEVVVTGNTGGSKTNVGGVTIVNNGTTVEGIDLDMDFVLSPNPAHNNIQVKTQEEMVAIQIYSLNGQLMQSLKASGIEMNVDIKGLDAGLYFMKVGTEEEWSTQKFVKF